MNYDRRWLDVKVQIGRVKMFTRLDTETVRNIPGIRRISTALPDYKIRDGYKNALYVDNNNAYQVIFRVMEIGLGITI